MNLSIYVVHLVLSTVDGFVNAMFIPLNAHHKILIDFLFTNNNDKERRT